MKTRWMATVALTASVLMLGATPLQAEAKRLAGGKPAGMQRQMPAKPADASPPAQAPHQAPTQAAPAAQPAPAAVPQAAAATPPKRSWLGPIAGLAAGIGLAALFSHLGWGEGLAHFMTLLLLGLVIALVAGWVLRRVMGGRRQSTGGLQWAGAGAGVGMGAGSASAPLPPAAPPVMAREALAPAATATPATAAAAAVTLPGGIEAADFERLAKQVFIRMQAANDAGEVEDLRRFTTPELFASLKADLLERGSATQKTDVLKLDARVVDTAEERGQAIVTVRFQGLIREAADAGAEPFDELWHLVRPTDGSRDWAIAGIAPTQ